MIRAAAWASCGTWLVGLLAVAIAGCGPRPRAPALLQGEPVYENKQEGFRFLPPPNWSQHARSELPSGPVKQERLLVGYKRITAPGQVASLDVSMMDVPSATDLAAFLEERNPKAENWRPAGAAESLEVDGKPAVRAAYQARLESGQVLKEIVAIRKGERVYFFTGVFPAGDARARDQVRKAVATVSW
jgi:hypothetical protein